MVSDLYHIRALLHSSSSYDDPSSVKPIWLTDIFCLSTDLELSECIHGNPIGYVNCVSGDAELECGKLCINDRSVSLQVQLIEVFLSQIMSLIAIIV